MSALVDSHITEAEGALDRKDYFLAEEELLKAKEAADFTETRLPLYFDRLLKTASRGCMEKNINVIRNDIKNRNYSDAILRLRMQKARSERTGTSLSEDFDDLMKKSYEIGIDECFKRARKAVDEKNQPLAEAYLNVVKEYSKRAGVEFNDKITEAH